MTADESIRSPAEIRRVFELLDNVNSVANKTDNFKYGLQVGKLIALGWVLREVTSSDLSLNYEFDDWLRDIQAQEDVLKQRLQGLEQLLNSSAEEEEEPR